MTDTSSLAAAPLWERTRALLARAIAALGGAAAIAAIALLSRTQRREIVAWLAPLEHIVRKLLLAEAAALHRSERENARRALRIEVAPLRPPVRTTSLQARHSAGIASGSAAGAARSNIDPTRPETWSATFSLAPPRDPLAVPDSRAPRIRALWGETPRSETHAPTGAAEQAKPEGARVSHSADAPFRLARRLEAIRRVLENPLPHAVRLARLLARAVRRFPEIVRRYLFAPARTGDYDEADPRLSVDAYGAALHAPHVITDSS